MKLSSPFRGWKRIRVIPGTIAGLVAATLINVAQWLYLIVKVKPQSDPIPLHYTIAFGIDRIGPWYSAFLLPISGTFILVMNFVLLSVISEHQRVSVQLIVALTLIMEMTLLTGSLLVFR